MIDYLKRQLCAIAATLPPNRAIRMTRNTQTGVCVVYAIGFGRSTPIGRGNEVRALRDALTWFRRYRVYGEAWLLNR